MRQEGEVGNRQTQVRTHVHMHMRARGEVKSWQLRNVGKVGNI